ncbi:MAG: hypothetical protein AB7O45_05205 [Alphaproteobacteria bacterium]
MKHVLLQIARRLAQDPRVQEKAIDALRWAKPRVQAAASEVRQAAREVDPRRDPKGFAKRVKERWKDRRET